MKLPITRLHIFLGLVLFPIVTFSQSVESQLQNKATNHYKKLYLHTDRENYFQNDTIWFKAYYLEGQTQLPVLGIYSMYMELIDKNGNTLKNKLWPITDGNCSGYFPIQDSIPQDDYLFRAYTDFQLQFGEDAYFHKILKISKAYTFTEEISNRKKDIEKGIDLAFLPEGGYLLVGQSNVVGIKATDEKGNNIAIKGKILNGQGEVVLGFATTYQGMGIFTFHPRAGEDYKPVVDQYPNYQHDFLDVKQNGIKLEFVREDTDKAVFRVSSNTKMFLGSKFSFAIMHRSKVIFARQFTLAEKELLIKVDRVAFIAGINRLILLDESMKPISERLYFSDNFDVNEVSIKTDKNSYNPRTEVKLEVQDNDPDAIYSNLSIGVINEIALNKGAHKVDIRSWLLLDSELKGHIERPNDFFIEETTITAKEKLNLLMLTHGWSKYVWNTISEKKIDPTYSINEGITLSGRVEQILGKKAKYKVEVELSFFNNGFFNIEKTKTNEKGEFYFAGLNFVDTASVFIQAHNKKGKPSWEVLMDSLFVEGPKVSKEFLPDKKVYQDISTDLRSQQYYSEMAMRVFVLDSGTILLEEVTVEGERAKKEEDGHYRIYAKPQNSLKVTEADINYRNVIDFLQGRVAGVRVQGNMIMIHGPSGFRSSEPLFLYNGMQVEKDVILNIPMNAIDVVEVLKDSEAAIYGTRGASGVIAVYSNLEIEASEPNYTPGTLSTRIIGYAAYREFYSPKYSPESVISGRPDHRMTLYWNPDIITIDGRASMSFFTSDDKAKYRIFVEGITENGKICLGTSELVVDSTSTNFY